MPGTSYKVSTFVSGILIICRNFSGILTRNYSAFSGILEQTLGFSGLLEMGLSGILEFSRKILGSSSLTVSSGPKKIWFRFLGHFISGSLIFTRKFSGNLARKNSGFGLFILAVLNSEIPAAFDFIWLKLSSLVLISEFI